MMKQARAQLDVDAVGRVRKQIVAQDSEHGVEQRDDDEADDEHVERGQRAVHQHLVDHDLEEQWRDQRKQLEEERGGQHLAEQPPVFADRADEPGDIELASEIG